MANDFLDPGTVEKSETKFALELRAAREKVAANPRDEQAAKDLFNLVRSAVANTQSGNQDNEEFWGAAPAPAVRHAVQRLVAGEEEEAEIVLRRHLSVVPNDTDAMRVMARIAVACGFPENAEKILRRTVEIEPQNAANWLALARFILEKAVGSDQRPLADKALELLERGLAADPEHYPTRSFQAGVMVQLRQLDGASVALDDLLRRYPLKVRDWLNLGHLRKTTGQFNEGLAAYRIAMAIDPGDGKAWFNFSNLKLAPFFAFDIELMERALGEKSRGSDNDILLHFALARAHEQAGSPEKAAPHLLNGNALRLAARPYDHERLHRRVERLTQTYSADFFEVRRGWGCLSPAPIFILGMPRSGSTLVEQILASHSAIEGTEELFIVAQIAAELRAGNSPAGAEEPPQRLARKDFEALGQRYLTMSKVHRRTERPSFTDKNPSNWTELGLIRSILPGARIIDVRRNPLDCCFANYAQHFNWGADFSYGQREVGSYYRDYVRLMRHFDTVSPGAIHRVIYDDLVDEFEAEVERLFAYLELDLEPACLRFFETERPVFTPSAEQVRQPINRAGMERWKPFEPWLGELKGALGPVLNDWRR